MRKARHRAETREPDYEQVVRRPLDQLTHVLLDQIGGMRSAIAEGWSHYHTESADLTRDGLIAAADKLQDRLGAILSVREEMGARLTDVSQLPSAQPIPSEMNLGDSRIVRPVHKMFDSAQFELHQLEHLLAEALKSAKALRAKNKREEIEIAVFKPPYDRHRLSKPKSRLVPSLHESIAELRLDCQRIIGFFGVIKDYQIGPNTFTSQPPKSAHQSLDEALREGHAADYEAIKVAFDYRA